MEKQFLFVRAATNRKVIKLLSEEGNLGVLLIALKKEWEFYWLEEMVFFISLSKKLKK